MKVHTGGPVPRIFYRHVAELKEDVVLTHQNHQQQVDDIEDSSERVFKFGAGTQVRQVTALRCCPS
jgi:hypothetical protein